MPSARERLRRRQFGHLAEVPLGGVAEPPVGAEHRRHPGQADLLSPSRDDPTARAGFVGLSDRHDRAALAFAIVEGVALGVRSVLAVLEQAGSPLSELRVGGGGARMDLAGQLKADLLGRPVVHLDIDPAGFGAAMLAADAAGLSGEAGAAIATTVRRARRFAPSGSLSAFEGERAAWFYRVRTSAAVHSPGELT